MDLGQVVVGQKEMNLAREFALQVRDPGQRFPASLGSVLVPVIAVNAFLKDELAVRVVSQVYREEQLFQVPPMIVQVAGDPDFAIGGQMHDLLSTHGRHLILLSGTLEDFDDFIRIEGHADHGAQEDGIRQPARKVPKPYAGFAGTICGRNVTTKFAGCLHAGASGAS